MFVANVVLTVAVLLVAFSVGFVILKLVEENRKLQTQLNVAKNTPSMIGIAYKTNSNEVFEVINSIKLLLVEAQMTACPMIRAAFIKDGKKFVKKIQDSTYNNPKMRCSDLEASFDKEVIETSRNMVEDMRIPHNNRTGVEEKMKDLLKTILRIICVNDKIDTEKADRLFVDIFNAICP